MRIVKRAARRRSNWRPSRPPEICAGMSGTGWRRALAGGLTSVAAISCNDFKPKNCIAPRSFSTPPNYYCQITQLMPDGFGFVSANFCVRLVGTEWLP
jgi:hypothetical protein